MSRRSSTFVEDFDFISRLVKVCGTKEPAKVARLLNVSYQSAKNYLAGRLPSSYVLQEIAKITPYSIHWLLTGEGDEFVNSNYTELPFEMNEEVRDFVRNVCLEAVSFMSEENNETSKGQKVIIISSDKIKKEKISESFEILHEKE